MNTASFSTVLLCPRPYSRCSGKLLLLPLLPSKAQDNLGQLLPAELWIEVFEFGAADLLEGKALLKSLLTVCKQFKDIVLPILYQDIELCRLFSVEKLSRSLHVGEQKWDSLRRIPYSAPGRWVQSLDLSQVTFTGQAEALSLDSALTFMFPLMPFLSHLSMNSSFILSRRALKSLADRETTSRLRSLEGISYVPVLSSYASLNEDPLVHLLRSCIHLEELEVIGQGPDPSELDFTFPIASPPLPPTFSPLYLPSLRMLTLLSMHSSPLMTSLLLTPLPSLTKLTITPYDDIPYPASQVSAFVSAHGQTLQSLLLLTPNSWPTRRHPSSPSILETCPNLRHLSLEAPLPPLFLESNHSLQILSIPRPTNETWDILQGLLRHLPRLTIVRTRDVRWLRKGMNLKSQAAGVQGDMQDWRRRLARWRIRLVDADWKDSV